MGGGALRVVALVGCLVLAGCGGFAVTDRDDGSPTLTPVPVPETGIGPDGNRLVAPGVSTSGVFDASVLASAHESTLDASRYRLARTQTVRYANASNASGTPPLNAISWRVAAEPGPEAYRFTKVEEARRVWVVSESYARIDIWYRGSVVRNRFVDAGRQERFWGSDRATSGGPVRDPTSHQTAASDLAAVELEAVGNETIDGTVLTRFRGSRLLSPDRLDVPPLVEDPRNVSMTATVDEDGVLRRYSVRYDATFTREGRLLRVERVYRVTDLGDARVTRPEWVAAANESVGGGR